MSAQQPVAKCIAGLCPPFQEGFHLQQATQEGEKAFGRPSLQLPAHHVNPFGVTDAGSLGNHGDIPFTLLFQQTHPEPAPDLTGKGGDDPQGGLAGINQGVPARNRFAEAALIFNGKGEMESLGIIPILSLTPP